MPEVTLTAKLHLMAVSLLQMLILRDVNSCFYICYTSYVNINNWLQESTAALKNVGIESARLDCLILLEKVLEINKTVLLADLEKDLKTDHIKILDEYIKQRAQHLPIAYITNCIEFYGLEFFVDKRVLIPRPETEQIIDHLLEIRPQPSLIYDIGTGSGILAITAKKRLPSSRVYAIDNSEDC